MGTVIVILHTRVPFFKNTFKEFFANLLDFPPVVYIDHCWIRQKQRSQRIELPFAMKKKLAIIVSLGISLVWIQLNLNRACEPQRPRTRPLTSTAQMRILWWRAFTQPSNETVFTCTTLNRLITLDWSSNPTLSIPTRSFYEEA